MQEPALAGERIVSDLMERVKGTARVEAVYGESRQVGEKTIIPVALVTYAFPAITARGRPAAGAGAGAAPCACTRWGCWRSAPARRASCPS